MERIFALYTSAVVNPGNSGGRYFVGFLGWHADAASAMAAIERRGYGLFDPRYLSASAV